MPRTAQDRPGSHSIRPKRAGFAAHEHSIADGRQHGKGARRANEALQRAKISVEPRISGVSGADQRGRRRYRGVRACATLRLTRGEMRQKQSDIPSKTLSPCHIGEFPGVFQRFKPFSAATGSVFNVTRKRFITKSIRDKKIKQFRSGLHCRRRGCFLHRCSRRNTSRR